MKSSKVLIVEDELVVAADIESHLLQNGLDVVGIADHYDQTLLLTERYAPDLVLVDIALRGERSGIDAAIAIRDRWRIPVVFLTGCIDEATLIHARSAAPYGFLLKPFRNKELNETIRIALEHGRSTRALFARQRWLAGVLGTLNDAVICIDSEGRVGYANAAAECITGWSANGAEGELVDEIACFTKFDGSPLLESPVHGALRRKESAAKQQYLLHAGDGTCIPVEISVEIIDEDGELRGAVMVLIDLTAQSEEARRAEIERDVFEERAQTAADELGQTRAELRALTADVLTTQEEDRRRIARDIHDDLGQRSALLGILIERVATSLPPDDATIDLLRSTVFELTKSLSDVSRRLHPSMIEDLGLAAAFTDLVARERAAGRDVRYTERSMPDRLKHEASTALYRIAQEALRNAGKHAPGAPVEIDLSCKNAVVLLQVHDSGWGFPQSMRHRSYGLGILSMQERARLVGGRLSIRSRPGIGTTIVASVPLEL